MKKIEPVDILFVRGRGRVRSLRISTVYLWAFVFFLALFVLVSVLVINSYLKIISENKDLREEKVKLTRLVNEYKFKSQLASQYHLLIEELSEVGSGESGQTAEAMADDQAAVIKPEAQTAPPGKTAKQIEQTKAAEPVKPVEPAKPAESIKSPPEAEEEKDQPLVDVSGLVLEPDRAQRTLTFSFLLRKADPKADRVTGYLIVVLGNRKVRPPRYAAYPVSIKLSGSEPGTTSYGHAFSIERGKTVKGTIQGVNDAADFSSAAVYVYNRDGRLLLKKELKAGNV